MQKKTKKFDFGLKIILTLPFLLLRKTMFYSTDLSITIEQHKKKKQVNFTATKITLKIAVLPGNISHYNLCTRYRCLLTEKR